MLQTCDVNRITDLKHKTYLKDYITIYYKKSNNNTKIARSFNMRVRFIINLVLTQRYITSVGRIV